MRSGAPLKISPLGGELGDVLVQVVLWRQTRLLHLDRDSHGPAEQAKVEYHGVCEHPSTEDKEVEHGLVFADARVAKEVAAHVGEDRVHLNRELC